MYDCKELDFDNVAIKKCQSMNLSIVHIPLSSCPVQTASVARNIAVSTMIGVVTFFATFEAQDIIQIPPRGTSEPGIHGPRRRQGPVELVKASISRRWRSEVSRDRYGYLVRLKRG